MDLNWILDMFLGDPVLDDRKRIVTRNFGIKNAITICVSLYALKLLMSNTKFGGRKRKKNMKGGANEGVIVYFGFLLVLAMMVFSGCSDDDNKNFCYGSIFALVCYVIFGVCMFFVKYGEGPTEGELDPSKW